MHQNGGNWGGIGLTFAASFKKYGVYIVYCRAATLVTDLLFGAHVRGGAFVRGDDVLVFVVAVSKPSLFL